jgi:hypothetical protein
LFQRTKKTSPVSVIKRSFLETIERVVEKEEHDENGTCDECASPGTITLFGCCAATMRCAILWKTRMCDATNTVTHTDARPAQVQ